MGWSRATGVSYVTKYSMFDLHRLLELAGFREDLSPTGPDHLCREEALRSFSRDGAPILSADDPRAAWLKHLFIEAIDNVAMLYEVDFYKLEKLRTLANHPNTSPQEKAAALAAIDRLLPPRPPQPDVPQGGYRNKGKVFSPDPGQTGNDAPPPRPSYTTRRGKTFA